MAVQGSMPMRRLLLLLTLSLPLATPTGPGLAGDEIYHLGRRRELFLDRLVIESSNDVRAVLQTPRDEGIVTPADSPWPGVQPQYAFGAVLHDSDRYLMYYRANHGDDWHGEVTCLLQSRDGKSWNRPSLGLIEVRGSRENNVLLDDSSVTHNFTPFIDRNPSAPASQRFKALGGGPRSARAPAGLIALASSDGIHWTRMQTDPILTIEQVVGAIDGLRGDMMFDSQNVSFWSESEACYVIYFRVYHGGVRSVARAKSQDFLHWTDLHLMRYCDREGEPLAPQDVYITQTQPYFRAPQLYLALGARLLSKPERRILGEDEAQAMQLPPKQRHGLSDAFLMTTRGGDVFDRSHLEAYLRPGRDRRNWGPRSNYPFVNVVQTGADEMSFYVEHHYNQPTAHVRRYSLRLDGFASLQGPYRGGRATTRLLRFEGSRLALNFATSAAGDVRVEIQDANGRPIPGYCAEECRKLIGDDIERIVSWKTGEDVSGLAARPIRLSFLLCDADLFSFHFTD